jgi:uncharacterized protein YbcI
MASRPLNLTRSRPGHGSTWAISNTVVKLVRENTGRGPTKARTSIRDNVVVVMLDQTLTKGEQNLVSNGRRFRGVIAAAVARPWVDGCSKHAERAA